MRFLGQDAAAGALRSLYAAAGAVVSGEFFGPSWKFNMNGPATRVRMPKRANDVATAHALWKASDKLTGAIFDRARDIRAIA